jgi:hypothetical protein
MGKASHAPTLRLVFAYEGATLRLIARQAVDAVPPPSDPPRVGEGRTGFWCELRDAQGSVLYSRVMQSPMREAVEVRSDDADRPLAWVKRPGARGQFTLLVPRHERARYVVFHGSPDDIGHAPGPAGEIARFDLARAPDGKEAE